MRKLLSSLFFLIASSTLLAYDAEIDGICYNFSGDEAEVTFRLENAYDNYAGNVIIPESVTYEGREYRVTGIGSKAFYRCSDMSFATIPGSVNCIADWAFCGCSGLSTINIPEGVTSIGIGSFYNCEKLTTIDIPDNVTNIGREAFAFTPWYNNQPDGLVYAGKVAYKYKGEMPEGTQIIIKEGTKGITEEAFKHCTGLTSIFIPQSVTCIGYAIVNYCSNLTSIKIEQGNSIYDSRNDCNAIIETATNILISGCKNTIIPTDVLRIGDFSFRIGSGLTSITIPEGVISIGFHAFQGCTGLKTINIPNSVMNIEAEAFQGCRGLTSVTFGGGITNIDADVFMECPNLLFVVCHAEIPPVCEGWTFGTAKKSTLFVPQNSIDAYKTADVWKYFKEIKDICDAETSLETLTNFKQTVTIFDLSGRKVNSQLRKKGVYIVNGKKLLY